MTSSRSQPLLAPNPPLPAWHGRAAVRFSNGGCRDCGVTAEEKAAMLAPKPMISVIINAHVEGPRLRLTVEAFRSNLGDWPHEFVVVADEATDGCADDLGPGVTVIKNAKRVGCGRAKNQALAVARGDVLIFLDAHHNVLGGKVTKMAMYAATQEAIFTPVVRDINYTPAWEIVQVDGVNQVPCDKGLGFSKEQYSKASNAWVKDHHLKEVRIPGVGFAISRKTLERIGGLNAYHGVHGSQERGIGLRAYMAGVPIKLFSDVVIGHEYRAGEPKPRGFKRMSPRDQSKNFWHAYFVVAGDEAWKVLRPRMRNLAKGGDGVTLCPEVIAERARFLPLRTRTDADLLALLSGKAAPAPAAAPLQGKAAEAQKAGLLDAVDATKLAPAMVARWRRAAELGIPVAQHPGEIGETFVEAAKIKPSVFLEVGSESGGSLYVYAGACAPGARIIAVDDGRTPRCAAILAKALTALKVEGYDVHLVKGNSHDPSTVESARKLAGGGVQFCHIDGDHSLAGAGQDWRDYGALVGPGGLIAFHDLCSKRCGIHAVWEEAAKASARAKEICLGVVAQHEAMGIGLVWKNAVAEVTASVGPWSSPKIDVHIAYEPGGRIGEDYNRIMRETRQEWVLFLDHDVLLLHPNWYEVCQKAIREHPDGGLFTTFTNNIACRHQKDPTAPANADIAAHRLHARKVWTANGYHCTENRRMLIAGFFMLTSKTVWKKGGGFPTDGFFGVDNEYHRRVNRAGFKCYRMDGLYCFHLRDRSSSEPWIAGVPTSATLFLDRTPLEMHRSSPIAAAVAPDGLAPAGKKAVYTCLTGGYDTLPPRPNSPGWEYIAFTTDPALTSALSAGWQIRLFEAPGLTDRQASRLPKIKPHLFLPDFERSIFMDASMVLKWPDQLCARVQWSPWTTVRHPHRRCIYAELEAIAARGKAPRQAAEDEAARYRGEGIPENEGLYEVGLLMRQHNLPEVQRISDAWWQAYVEAETQRDQPAFVAALWRLGANVSAISATERKRWISIRPHNVAEVAR